MRYFLDLIETLKKGVIAPVYLFYGEEIYLQEQMIKRFKNELLSPETVEFNFNLVDGEETSIQQIVTLAETLPFMGERRLIVVRNPPFLKAGSQPGKSMKKLAGEGENILLKYLASPLLTTCLVFVTAGEVDKRRKLFQEIVKAGKAVEFTKLRKGDLAKWLQKEARLAGKKILPEAVEILLESCRGRLLLLSNEFQKVLGYVGSVEEISKEDVLQILTPRIEETIFAFVDAVATMQCRRALESLKGLLAFRESPQVIITMLARQFRLVLQAKELTQSGCTEKELSNKLQVHPYVLKKLIDQSKNLDRIQLLEAMDGLKKIDLAVKTGQQEFYPAMEMLLLKLWFDKEKCFKKSLH